MKGKNRMSGSRGRKLQCYHACSNSFDRSLNEFEVEMIKESKRLVEKFGMPQVQQIQDTSGLERALNIPDAILRQSTWYHRSQVSQHMARGFHLHAF